MSIAFLLFCLFLVVGMVAAFTLRKLTFAGAITGGALGLLIYLGLGWTGVLLMASFFVMGTGATAWRNPAKQAMGLAQENVHGRTAGQVLANGGAAGLFALAALIFPQQASQWLLLAAGAFSSAAADTLSSELGSVYGRRFYDVLNFRNGTRGNDGVISIEGLLAGVAGSAVIASIHALHSGWTFAFAFIVAGGTAGNLVDSYLGATLERRGIIGNDAVNFVNTVAGALVAWGLAAAYAGLLMRT